MQQISDGVPREQSTEKSTWTKIDTRLNTAGIHPQSEKGGKILDYILTQLLTRTNPGPADTNSIGRILGEIPQEIISGKYKNEFDSYSSRGEGIDSESNERTLIQNQLKNISIQKQARTIWTQNHAMLIVAVH